MVCRCAQLAKVSEATLKKRTGSVDSPNDVTALAELTRRFEERRGATLSR
jgi:hypothetical protein